MTEKQLWMKMDQVAESKKYDAVERCKEMALLIVRAYFEDQNFYLGYKETDEGQMKPVGVMFKFREDDQGEVTLPACFSSPRMAKTAPSDMIALKTKVRGFLNELFKKQFIPGIVVNPYSNLSKVVIPRSVFEKMIPEEERIME